MNLSKFRLSRRDMLKAAALSVAANSLAGCSSGEPEASSVPSTLDDNDVLPWSNWSGNQNCQPTHREVPRTEDELCELLKRSTGKIRFVGSSHSFSPLVPTPDMLISLAALRGVISVDAETGEASIWAGTRLAQIGEPLWEQGRGLINQPDIDSQALAGAIATSTHGTGATLGSLSSDVTRIRLVTAHGEVVECSRDRNEDLFDAARTSFGALGAVSQIAMRTREAYKLRERTWMMRLQEGLERAAKLRDEHRHFEMYALPHGDYIQGITLDETTAPDSPPDVVNNSEAEFRKAAKVIDALPFLRSLIINLAAGTVDPEERTGRSYRILGNVRSTRFNEMEYTVPAEHGPECLAEILDTIRRDDVDVIFPLEYRYVQADDVWLSPFYQRPGCAISCHNFHDRDYQKYFAAIEPIFWKYQGRPHPGKIHTLEAKQLAQLYPRWDDFLRIRRELDPQGRLLNDHLQRVFGVAA
jgi:FAD-linked oxidoreductase